MQTATATPQATLPADLLANLANLAVEHQRPLRFLYVNEGRRRALRRDVIVSDVRQTAKGDTILVGCDAKRGGRARSFRLDRITSVPALA